MSATAEGFDCGVLRLANVGRASRRKQERRLQRRSRPRLLTHVREQHELLRAVGGGFDDGTPVLALPLAVTIRTLVHNTQRSAALLAQLNELDELRFVDTALYIDPGNLMDTWGVVLMEIEAGGGARWIAPLGGELLSPARIREPVPFRKWWTTPMMTSKRDGRAWSRRDLVLFLANKEGAAHVDPYAPDETLRALEEDNSWGWTTTDPIVGDSAMRNGPIRPSIRQIAWELEQTIAPLAAHE